MKRIGTIFGLMLLALSCTREMGEEIPGGEISFSMQADIAVEEQLSKVTLGGDALVWESEDQVGVIVGDTGCTEDKNSKPFPLSSVGLGRFAGSVTLGENHSLDNIWGVVYPYSEDAFPRYRGGDSRLAMCVPVNQVQQRDNLLNGANFPMFVSLMGSDLKGADGTYSVEGKTFEWACTGIRFSIYDSKGSCADGESLLSVKLISGADRAIAGFVEWCRTAGKFAFNGSTANPITVTLTEPCPMTGKSSAISGAKIYMSLLPRGCMQSFSSIEVTTTIGTYTKTFERQLDLQPGKFHILNLDMSTMTCGVLYSADGAGWTDNIPAKYSSLAVKGKMNDEQALSEIVASISAQDAPVDLDLSGTIYHSVTFPKIFSTGSEGGGNPNIKSIQFPANIIKIAASAFAYCANLESVELSGIANIGDKAFFRSGLRGVTVPGSVTAIGDRAFRCCYQMKDIDFNAKISSIESKYLFAHMDTDTTSFVNGTYKPLGGTITIGPDVEIIPQWFIRSNSNIAHIVIKGKPTIGEQAFRHCRFLEDITCEAAAPPVCADAYSYNALASGYKVPKGKKFIYVPACKGSLYAAKSPWSDFVAQGYKIKEIGDAPAIPYGESSFIFTGYAPLSNLPVTVYCYIPLGGDIKTMPILFAMHGANRNAYYQITSWKNMADTYNIIVIAPEFSKELYPQINYQYVGVSTSSSRYKARFEELWTVNVIESLFDYFRQETGNLSEKYDLWGHSAGSQFSHRTTLFSATKMRVDRVVCSNAGSYTVPDPDGISDGSAVYGFPYSICDANFTRERLAAYFALPLTVHVGTADTASTKEEDDQLPVTPGAYAQGPCRYERGKFFYARSKEVAERLGLPFNWQLVEVPGIAHNSRGMAQHSTVGAGVILYGNK